MGLFYVKEEKDASFGTFARVLFLVLWTMIIFNLERDRSVTKICETLYYDDTHQAVKQCISKFNNI